MKSTSHINKSNGLEAQKIALLAIVLALRIVLSFIPSLNLGNIIEVGFGFLGAMLSGILFGPWYGALVSIASDLITSLTMGSAFFPGFTLSAALGGFIYGWVLWRKPLNWKRFFVSVLLVSLIVNIGLNSLWIKIMYDKAFVVIMPARIIKNIISLPVNTILGTLLFTNPTVKSIIKRFQF